MPIEHTTVDHLLADLAPLSHPARMRTLASWARAQAQLGPSLAELDGRGPYERGLAVFAAAAGRDLAFLEGRLADPDGRVRSHALKAALRLPVSDGAIARAMDDAPEAVRRQLATAVVAGGRTALAEQLLPTIRELWGDEEAVRLLPGCGPETVARLLPELFLAVVRWHTLGGRYPDLVLDEVARRLAELPEQSRLPWWYRNADVFAATAEARPLRVLDLLERHCPAHLPTPVRQVLGHLLKAAPGRTVRLITAPGRQAVPLSRTALRRLGLPELVELGRAWREAPDSLVSLLRVLPPSRREGCYDAITAGQDLSRSELSTDLLDALPRHRTQAEARRMAAQAAERGKPWATVLAAVAHLPVAEARPQLLAGTRRPAAEDRALAYALLITNAGRAREAAAVAEVLGELPRLRNEQEPVRNPALRALADVPPRLFTGADAVLLDRLTTEALEARDSNIGTRWALATLALRLLREHASSGELPLTDWALNTIRRISGHVGSARLGHVDTSLRRGQERQLFEALRPLLAAGAERADHTLTLDLAHALGPRARRLPELQELLWQAVQFGDHSTSREAATLWLDAPATRDERAVRLLALEPSMATLSPVLHVLTHRRTDLLHLILGDTPPYGRFLPDGARWQPPAAPAGLWIPAQQAAAAQLLRRSADDTVRPMYARAETIRAAAAIPGYGFELARHYLDSPDTVLAEAALAALAWTDRPAEALPLLLAHAADDRARVALYAAGRAAKYVAPSQLEQVLRAALLPTDQEAPVAKVTSRKELVRLAATRLPAATAAAVLAEAYELPGQHPDVQAACVPVAAGLLRSPAAWRVLERAADGPPVTQAAVLRTQPYELQDAELPRYARLVGRIARSTDPESADAALGLLARWSPWYPEAEQLLLTATVDLDNRSSWRAAADGLVALAASPDSDGPLLAALEQLAATGAEEFDAAAERDLPARQRIDHLAARLTVTLTMRPTGGIRSAADRAAELLCAAPDFLPQGAQLRTHTLDLDAPPARLLPALRRLAALHADRPALAARTAETLRHRLSTSRPPGDPLTLLDTAEQLTADGDHAGGLLALALTQALGTRTSWSPQWRSQLRALRRHPRPDVREAALALTTTVE